MVPIYFDELAVVLKACTRLRPDECSPAQLRRLMADHLAHTDPGRASLFAWQARARFARGVAAPGIDRLADHILHMVHVAGAEHVGLGSDFDGIAAVPDGLENVASLPRLAETLGRRGLTARVIDQVFAENWLRVLDSVS